MTLRIGLTSVFVADQAAALAFYTDTLGFVPKHDIPLGGTARWLTVVSPDDPDGTELLLEPDAHPAARTYAAALLADGIPAASFGCADVDAEHARLTALGVEFTMPPTDAGTVRMARFADTCGNLLQITSPLRRGTMRP